MNKEQILAEDEERELMEKEQEKRSKESWFATQSYLDYVEDQQMKDKEGEE